ncbi:MAG TPA: CHAT domain-containing protein [Kofleriaceae bacterium]|nr:CHAT domain-containing protein [Kofleriaceae bacterium]
MAIACATACSYQPTHRCVEDIDARRWQSAYEICQAEYQTTRDPARAIDGAKAALYLHRPDEMLRLAPLGLSAPATVAVAHYLLGTAYVQLEECADARDHLEPAVKLLGASGDARTETRAQQQLSGAYFGLGEYQRALDALAASREAALRVNDDSMTNVVHMARADILIAIGDLAGAEGAVEQALATARNSSSRVHALLRQGTLHIEQKHAALARDPLARALREEHEAPEPRRPVLEALHLLLSFVERKAGAYPQALEQIRLARETAADDASYPLYRGQVMLEMGDAEGARRELAAAEPAKLHGDPSWKVPFSLARAEALLHNAEGAIAADRRAIQSVASLALKSGVFGPTVIASHREPHLHLIGLYAAHHRWDDVLEVVAAIDGQSLLDSTEVSADQAPNTIARPLPTRPEALAPSWNEARRAVDAWRGRHLTIIVPGGDRVWRLDVADGHVEGTDIGEEAALGELARKLEADPGNVEAGRELGQIMLPDVAAGAPIELLVIGPLARAPLAALRIGDERAIARHPLVRVPGLLPQTPRAQAGDAVIAIGDPNGDLPQAASETRKLATRLQGNALIGPAATRAAFANVAGARLLHVAAHTTRRGGAATLKLADGAVSLDDIARLSPAPRVVVLASCGASAGRDDAGNGSLTSAFLGAGTEVVVGTRWSIDDAEAAELIQAFYAAGGDRDAVHALAAAQLASKLRPTTWAAFEVFLARPAR